MTKIATFLLALLFSTSAILAQTPVMTMTTARAVGSTFSFYLRASAANTPVQVDFGDGTLVAKIVGTSTTSISGTLISTTTVKIYGDSITYLDCHSNRLTALDVINYTALKDLNCSDNQLTALDVSNNTALIKLDCSNNQLTALDVSKNTALTDLSCYNNPLTTLDVSKNTALGSLNCNNNQLTTLDVSKNTALGILNCGSNQLTTLDVSKNTALTRLSCIYNQLNTLDVSKSTALFTLYCYNNQLTTLDVSNNTELYSLDCSDNQLTTLDVSKNTALWTFDCSSNRLTTLDVSKNTAMISLDCHSNQLTTLVGCGKNMNLWDLNCSSNRLTFATLAATRGHYYYYFTYSPQQAITILKATLTNTALDLSAQNIGYHTVYSWITKGGTTLTAGIDYTITGGITTFLKPQTDSVYCTMTNATFPDFTGSNVWKTTCTLVTQVMTMTTAQAVGSIFSFTLQALADNTPVQVDFGNGTLVADTVGTSPTAISGTLVSTTTVKIYGNGITYLDCSNNQLTALDVSNNPALNTLDCSNNQLFALDVSNNPALNTLDCSFNQITALDVSINKALSVLFCSSNQLTFATLPLKQASWTAYSYSPQNAISLAKATPTNTALDLSAQNTINGNTTVYSWITKGGTTLTAGTDYTIAGGITTFLKPQTDSVYCTMTNATFPDFTGSNVLKTTCTLVTHVMTMTTAQAVGSTFSFTLQASVANTPVQVDFGNGTLVADTVGTSPTAISGTLVSTTTVKIYGNSITYLDCSNNQLTTLDVSTNAALTTLACSFNQLTFATLPLKQASWTAYSYSPQNAISLVKATLTNTALDLSAQNTINDNTTVYSWITKGGTTLTAGTDYTIAGGITTFLKYQSDSVYCTMTNATFPDFTGSNVLKTTCTFVTHVMTMTTTQAVGSIFSFTLQASAANTPVQVDFGNGTLVADTVGTSPTVISGTLVSTTLVKIYGSGIIYLKCTSNQLTALDVSNNTALIRLDCNGNQLTTLDVSKNTALIKLECSNNQLTALDVTNYTALKDLNCNNNKLTALDVSKKTALTTLECNNNQLTALDVSKNTALTVLYCFSNQLTTLDVSNNTALSVLYCYSNKLTTLDVSKNIALTVLYCFSNQLTFATLPLKQASWTTYTYSPQNAILLAQATPTNTALDLSAQNTINGNTTVYSWITKGGAILTAGTDYTITGGITTFLKSQTDSVYCTMTNAAFPDFTGSNVLKTTCTLVTHVMTMTTAQGVGSISFTLKASADNTTVQVDFGNGTLVTKTVGTTDAAISGTLVNTTTVKIYGSGIKFLGCFGNYLTALDVSNNTALIGLDCSGNKLINLDVSNNTALTDLWCSSNQLTTLDVSNNTALTFLWCNSNHLTTLDVSNNTALTNLWCCLNHLTTLDVSNSTALTYLRCYSNQLTTLDVSNNSALTYLDCTFNQITALDVSKNTALNLFECSSNQLTTLDVSNNIALYYLDCSSNKLTFATLPLKQESWTYFNYSPQQAITILKATPIDTALDLSTQNTINGNTTVYSWITKGDTTLTSGTDYTIAGGITTFLKPQTDSVYCTMTNAAFPDFNGSDVLKTTCTLVTHAGSSTQIKANKVVVYAANKTVYITVPSDAHALVYDINGRIVTEKSLKAGNNQISLLNGGIYTVKLVTGGGAVTKKVWVE